MNDDKALAVIQPSEWQMMTEMAKVLHGSNFLPQSVKTPQAALAIILAGRELGIGPWQAFDSIHIIQNKPTISPKLMLALIERSGLLEDIHIDDTTTIKEKKGCTVTMKRRGRAPHSETFTFQDAKDMDLADKDNWKRMQATMCKWRAVSACCRVVFPDVILGIGGYDEVEDAGARVDIQEDGEAEVVQLSRDQVHAAKGRLEGRNVPKRLPTGDERTTSAPMGTEPTIGNVDSETGETVEDELEAAVGDAGVLGPKWTGDEMGRFVKDMQKREFGIREIKAGLGVKDLADWPGSLDQAYVAFDAYLERELA